MSTIITAAQLDAMLPTTADSVKNIYLPLLQAHLPLWGIDTPQRLAGFMAQTAFECINYTVMTEEDSGENYEFNKVLGNTEPGDGPLFKGRGPIQLTGRGNYTWYSKSEYSNDSVVVNPALVAQPLDGVKAACFFFKVAKPTLLETCDRPENWMALWEGKNYTKVQWMTILINGGLNGIAGRTGNYQRAKTIFGF